MDLLRMLFKGSAKRVESVEPRKIIYSDNNDNRDYTEAGLRDKLEQHFREEYSYYEVKKDVPVSEFGYSGDARNYSYAIYYYGRPVLFIMIINGNNDYRKADVVASHEIADKQRVKCLNFMSYMKNTQEYISKRIADNIG